MSKYEHALFGDLDAAASTSETTPGTAGGNDDGGLGGGGGGGGGGGASASAAAASAAALFDPKAMARPAAESVGESGAHGGEGERRRRKRKTKARPLTAAEAKLKAALAQGTLLARGPLSQAETLNTALLEMARNGVLCDASLDVDGTLFTVHRAVLAAVSPYFAAVFEEGQGGGSSSSSSSSDPIPCTGFDDPALFAAVLEFMYMGSVRVFIDGAESGRGPDEVLKTLLNLAAHYQVEPLVGAVVNETIRRLSVENAIGFLGLARGWPGDHMERLASACLHILRIKLDAFCGAGLNELELADLLAVIGSDDVAVSSEMVVVDIAFAWLKVDKSRFRHKDPVLSSIRYYALTDSELEDTRSKLNRAMNASIVDPQLEAVASGAQPKTMRAHAVNPITCRSTKTLKGPGPPLFCGSVGDRTKFFVAGAADGTVSVWRAGGEWESVATLQGHKGPVRGAAIVGATLYTVSHDRSIRGWDTVGWATTTSLYSAHQSPIWSIAEYDLMIVTGDAAGIIKIWQEDDGLDIFNGGVTGAGLSLTATLKDHGGGIVGMATSGASLYSASMDGSVRVWNIMNHTCLKVLVRGSGPGRSLALTTIQASGTAVAAAYVDGSIVVWRKVGGPGTRNEAVGEGAVVELDVQAESNGRTVRALLFVDDVVEGIESRWMVSGSTDGTIKVWDMAGGTGAGAGAAAGGAVDGADEEEEDDAIELVRTLEFHTQSVNGLVGAGAGDRGCFVSASSDGQARVWE